LSPNTQRDAVSFCAERARLLKQYGEAVARFTDAGKLVSDCAITYDAGSFDSAWQASQNAWQECFRLRHLLQQHLAEHGC
jgi:hypothetical protein